ncbi:MAG: hypothetical protein ACKVZ6_16370 [Kineosporiaceae bacterium]|jgi:hypothetical protein
MNSQTSSYLALACPWDGAWQVFVLCPREGLIGAVDAPTLDDVEPTARGLVRRYSGGLPADVPLQVLRR